MFKVLILLTLVSSQAFAQLLSEVNKTGVNYLETIEVIETDLSLELSDDTLANETIGLEDIDHSLAGSLDDILKSTSGSTTLGGPRSSSESIQVRGLSNNKIFVYVDGARQNFRTGHGATSMQAIEVDNLKAINIFKDNSNLSQGTSLGGGVSYITKDATDFLKPGQKNASLLKTTVQGSGAQKSYSYKNIGKEKDRDYLLSFTKKSSDDIKLSDGSTLRYSSFDDTTLFGKFRKQFKSLGTVSMSVDFFNRKDNVPINPNMPNPPETAEYQDLFSSNEINKSSYVLNNSYKKDHLKRNMNLYYVEQSLERTKNGDTEKEQRDITTIGGSLKNKLVLQKNNEFGFGFEYMQDTLTGNQYNSPLSSYPRGETKDFSAYLELEKKFNSGTTISPGLKVHQYVAKTDRTEDEKKKNTKLTKKLSLSQRIKNVDVFANYSEGYNAPRVQELFPYGLHHKGDDFFIMDNWFITNYELSPESSQMLELGAKANYSFSSVDLITVEYAQYWSHVDNYIYFEKTESIDPGTTGTTQFVNAPVASLKGSDASITYLIHGFEGSISYSQIRGVNKSLGQYFSELPADQYIYKLQYNFFHQGISVGYQGINSLKQDRVNPETLEVTEETASYFIHNIFADKTFNNGFKIAARIDNLTNRRYRKHGSNINEVGLDYKLALQYQIKHF